MIQSMTGYGRVDTDIFTIECRSVNHRYIDVNIKTPPYLYHLEPQMRKLIKEEFVRGKISVTVTPSSHMTSSLHVNLPLARELQDAFLFLKDELSLEDNSKLEHFFKFKEVLTMEEPEVEDTLFLEALKQSLSRLKKMREHEGAHLLKDIRERLSTLNQLVTSIDDKRGEHAASIKTRYLSRIKELINGIAIDEVRLIQEVAVIAEKCDITEEIVRIRTHVEHFINILEGTAPSGKKMDFLCQELNREINTIGSKANNADIATVVINMKSELEKLREQIQNIQ